MVLSLAGDGLTVADVPARAVADMVGALLDVLDGLARAVGEKPVPLSLVKLGRSPVSFQLSSSSSRAARLVKDLVDLARRRGVGASPEVRRGLERLHAVASRVGAPRLCGCGPKGEEVGEPVHLGPPHAEGEPGYEQTHEVHGRVVGVVARGTDGASVRLRLEDGAVRDFLSDGAAGGLAARLYGRTVRARVALAAPDADTPHALLGLEAWEDEPLLDVLTEARAELAAEGLRVSADEWLAQLKEQG